MKDHQQLQQALGVSTALLDALVRDLCDQSTIFGAKISGSGLGDCIVGLGTLEKNVFPINVEQQKAGVQQIAVKITTAGYNIQKGDGDF